MSTSAASVSVLRGNGSAGVGNGTFLAAVAVPTLPSPAAIATADLNGDGIADLIVGSSTDTTLAVHFGNGTAGIGDGTFAAAVLVNCAVPATGVAVGDFDEDGTLDVAFADLGQDRVGRAMVEHELQTFAALALDRDKPKSHLDHSRSGGRKGPVPLKLLAMDNESDTVEGNPAGSRTVIIESQPSALGRWKSCTWPPGIWILLYS